MYKLLLVSDQDEVLDAFNQVGNWERLGFKPPHIRHDFEGTKDSLAKHHADGISIAVSSHEEEEKILAYLQEFFPYVSIFEAGRTVGEVITYLNELNTLLNRIRADFSNDRFLETDMLAECRHEFFRRLMNGKVESREELCRNMRLLRSRMDADQPCMLIELEQSALPDDRLEGRWQYGDNRLELALRNTFGGDIKGIHVLPTVHPDGRILILACPLHGLSPMPTGDALPEIMKIYVSKGMEHLKEYFGLELSLKESRVLPALHALCVNAGIKQ